MIILGTNSIKDTGYDVANSLRFNSGSNDFLNKTNGTPTNSKKFTTSVWIKRSKLGEEYILDSFTDSQNKEQVYFRSDDNSLVFFSRQSNSTVCSLRTSRLFRDTSAWSNIIMAIDTTQGTASNRFKIYVNGVQETSFATETYPNQNVDFHINTNNKPLIIGEYGGGGSNYNGYISEYCLIDGQQLDPTSFGESDEDSGIWKPIDVSGLTFGNNGFYLDFEDSGALGDDVSGNGNDFTVNNLTAIDQTTDTCTNNFALANPLNVNASNVGTFAFGNTTVKVANSSGFSFGSSSTIGVSSGKWYCEAKIITVDATMVGVSANVAEDARDNYPPGVQGGTQSVAILVASGNKYIDDSGSTHGAALSADDILMIALDLDNNNVYFGKNGSWFDGSGNADESNPTSAIAVTAVGSTAEGAYFFSFGDGGGSAKGKVSWNFGNASHAISSGNTDGDGFGNFEYAVPSGYFSLCTKNLAEYG